MNIEKAEDANDFILEENAYKDVGRNKREQIKKI